jgi:hypothetical protein
VEIKGDRHRGLTVIMTEVAASSIQLPFQAVQTTKQKQKTKQKLLYKDGKRR